MVSKGQIVGIDWNRIARLHSHVLAHMNSLTASRCHINASHMNSLTACLLVLKLSLTGIHEISCRIIVENAFAMPISEKSLFRNRSVYGCCAPCEPKTRNPGVTMTANFTLSSHIIDLCNKAFFSIGRVRKYPPQDTLQRLVNALDISHLDYWPVVR